VRRVLRELCQDILGRALGKLSLQDREDRHREPLGLLSRCEAGLLSDPIEKVRSMELHGRAIHTLASGPDFLPQGRKLGRELFCFGRLSRSRSAWNTAAVPQSPGSAQTDVGAGYDP
jgi:hypothetical protein